MNVVGGSSPWGSEATSPALEEDIEQAAEERTKEVFNDAQELADKYDVEITTEVQLGHPARTIVNRANDLDAVVIGSHGGSLVDRLVIGNVAQQVFRNSPVSVIVAR